MFTESADLYDAIYAAAGKDYRAESEQVTKVIRAANPAADSLLDVACGTGRHLERLGEAFADCAGIDIEPAFVAHAARNCPRADVRVADMREFDLGRRFDAIVCLFSSIGYVRDDAGLYRAVRAMARHLNPGGVLVIEPSFTPAQWTVGLVHALFVDEPDLKAARFSRSDRTGDVAILDMHYLVGDDAGVRCFSERHELGLFDLDAYRDACGAVGLSADVDPHGLTGRGLVTARSVPTWLSTDRGAGS